MSGKQSILLGLYIIYSLLDFTSFIVYSLQICKVLQNPQCLLFTSLKTLHPTHIDRNMRAEVNSLKLSSSPCANAQDNEIVRSNVVVLTEPRGRSIECVPWSLIGIYSDRLHIFCFLYFADWQGPSRRPRYFPENASPHSYRPQREDEGNFSILSCMLEFDIL